MYDGDGSPGVVGCVLGSRQGGGEPVGDYGRGNGSVEHRGRWEGEDSRMDSAVGGDRSTYLGSTCKWWEEESVGTVIPHPSQSVEGVRTQRGEVIVSCVRVSESGRSY